jgi:hypothetical protein
MVIYCAFVYKVSEKPLVPVVGFVRLKLRPLADFGFRVWFSWTVGVALLIVLFHASFSAVSVLVVTLLTAVGFTMLLMPQLAVHRALTKTKEDVLNAAWKQFFALGYHDVAFAKSSSLAERVQLQRFLESVSATSPWPYDFSQGFLIAGTYLIPIATLAVQSTFRVGTP